jgi:hypothetical protein
MSDATRRRNEEADAAGEARYNLRFFAPPPLSFGGRGLGNAERRARKCALTDRAGTEQG